MFATAIVSHVLPPGEGAALLWPLWEHCGVVPGTDPLDMLQLHDEWEATAGDAPPTPADEPRNGS